MRSEPPPTLRNSGDERAIDASRTHALSERARPDLDGAVCFGVRGDDAGEPLTRYLYESAPVDDELLALAQPVDPMEVLRFAAPSAGGGCQHFDGNDCKLVDAIAELPAVVRLAPRCRDSARLPLVETARCRGLPAVPDGCHE